MLAFEIMAEQLITIWLFVQTL